MTARAFAALALAGGACTAEPDRPPCTTRSLTELEPVMQMESPWLTVDRTEIFFNAHVSNGFGIYHASRSAHTGAFMVPEIIVDNMGAGADAFDATLSSDGTIMWFVVGSGDGGGYIFQAVRNAPGDSFGTPQQVFQEVTAGAAILHPTFTSDKKQVFFAQRLGTDFGFDIYTANRADENARFGTPKPVTGINTSMDEETPTISPDGSILYFNSPRFGDASEQQSGTSRLGFATAASGFTDPQPLAKIPHVDGKSDEMGWVSPGGDTIVFASRRPGGQDSVSSLWIACE